MYDHSNEVKPKLKCPSSIHFEDDLNTPEVSFDFQGFLNNSSSTEDLHLFSSALDPPPPLIKQEPSPDSQGGVYKRSSSLSKRHSKKSMDKNSDEYRRRRERNNQAVRKSREKAKQRSKDTESRVNTLLMENDTLKKRAEMLAKELSIIKTLLKNVGIPSENIEMEINQVMQHQQYNLYSS